MVSDSLSTKSESVEKGGERENRSASPFPYTDIFNQRFPYYLSIGMTEEQYWDRDSCLVKYYREAEELKKERMNQEAWLQGMYFYDALSRISPILRAFAKKGTKAQSYVEEPYPISKKKVEDAKLKKEKLNQQKGMRYMQAFMVANNERYKKGSE